VAFKDKKAFYRIGMALVEIRDSGCTVSRMRGLRIIAGAGGS